MRYVHTISILGFLAITIIVYSSFEKASSNSPISTPVNKLGPITVNFTHTLEQEKVAYSKPDHKTPPPKLEDNHNKIENKNLLDQEESAKPITEKIEIAEHKDTNTKSQTPFFSQFTDISDPSWRKVGCGIASLAMIIELYNPGKVSVDNLLTEGIKSGAYLNDAGWIHKGLISLAQKYGLSGNTRDLSALSTDGALKELEGTLINGPVMASVHYTFDPQNPIPHLVVINKIVGDTVYYNDPSEISGNGSISTPKFLKAWKKRYIEIRPV